MFDLNSILTEIAETNTITLNGITYIVSNCVAAEDDGIIKLNLCLINKNGKLLKIFIESVN